MPATCTCEVIIVGAGLAGLFLAITLRTSGHKVTILEKSPSPQEYGAGINISPNAVRLFDAQNLLPDLTLISHELDHGVMRHYQSGEEISRVEYTSCREVYGAPYYVAHRVDLHALLYEKAQSLEVKCIFDAEVQNIKLLESKRQSVTDTSNRVFHADVVFGADGERSATRGILLKSLDVRPRDSGDHVYRSTIPIDDSFEDEELMKLITPFKTSVWAGPDSHVVTYRIHKDDVLNIVIQMPHAKATRTAVESAPTKSDAGEVLETIKDWDPVLRKIVGMGKEWTKWSLLEYEPVSRWVSPDCAFALLGDAAHPLLPWLGQGAALAFEDAAMLGLLFENLDDMGSIRSKLKTYEDRRSQRVVGMRELLRDTRRMYRNLDSAQLRDSVWADPVRQKQMFGYHVCDDLNS